MNAFLHTVTTSMLVGHVAKTKPEVAQDKLFMRYRQYDLLRGVYDICSKTTEACLRVGDDGRVAVRIDVAPEIECGICLRWSIRPGEPLERRHADGNALCEDANTVCVSCAKRLTHCPFCRGAHHEGWIGTDNF